MIALTTDYLDVKDYLQWEEQQEEKHEYVDGMSMRWREPVKIMFRLTILFPLALFTKILNFQKMDNPCNKLRAESLNLLKQVD